MNNILWLVLLLLFVASGCSKIKNEPSDGKDIDFYDGITINDLVGDWHLAKGTDKLVPISETKDELPIKVTVTSERICEGDDIRCWTLSIDRIFDTSFSTLDVDPDGDILGYKGIISGSIFTGQIFRRDKGILTMMVFTLVTDYGPNGNGDSEWVHVANYYKQAQQPIPPSGE